MTWKIQLEGHHQHISMGSPEQLEYEQNIAGKVRALVASLGADGKLTGASFSGTQYQEDLMAPEGQGNIMAGDAAGTGSSQPKSAKSEAAMGEFHPESDDDGNGKSANGKADAHDKVDTNAKADSRSDADKAEKAGVRA